MTLLEQGADQALVAVLVAGVAPAFVESAFGVGLAFPGEASVAGLAVATSGSVRLAALVLALAAGAVAGDHVGYLVGHRWGTRLRGTRLVARVGVRRWDPAAGQLRRHGAFAVFSSRLLPFVRSVMPAAAGAARLSYVRFLTGSTLGGLAWAGLWVGLGSGVRSLADSASWAVVIRRAAGPGDCGVGSTGETDRSAMHLENQSCRGCPPDLAAVVRPVVHCPGLCRFGGLLSGIRAISNRSPPRAAAITELPGGTYAERYESAGGGLGRRRAGQLGRCLRP